MEEGEMENGCNARRRVLRFAGMKVWEVKVWKSNVECALCCISIVKSFRFDFTLKWHGMGRTRRNGEWFLHGGCNDDSGEWRCECKGKCVFDGEGRVNLVQWIGPTLITQRSLRGGECYHYGILQSTLF